MAQVELAEAYPALAAVAGVAAGTRWAHTPTASSGQSRERIMRSAARSLSMFSMKTGRSTNRALAVLRFVAGRPQQIGVDWKALPWIQPREEARRSSARRAAAEKRDSPYPSPPEFKLELAPAYELPPPPREARADDGRGAAPPIASR